MQQPKINTDASNETIGKETGDYCPVFYNAFARFAQSAEMLRHALRHTDQRGWFVVNEHVWYTVPFFTIYGWKQKNIFP